MKIETPVCLRKAYSIIKIKISFKFESNYLMTSPKTHTKQLLHSRPIIYTL